jgi:hypothetical protein
MSKHTPGPWTVECDEQGKDYSVWHDPRVHGDMKRGAVVICADMRGGKEAKANARLIAAAPDLLAEVEATLSWLETLPHLSGVTEDERQGFILLLRAVIAKATGKKPVSTQQMAETLLVMIENHDARMSDEGYDGNDEELDALSEIVEQSKFLAEGLLANLKATGKGTEE